MSSKPSFRTKWNPIALGLVVLTGCGGPSMAPVSGTVTLGGKPVGEIMVVFQPQPKAGEVAAATKRSVGVVDAAGHYELATFKPGDGAAVGTHRVTIVSSARTGEAPGKLPDDFAVEVKSGSNVVDLELERLK